MTQPINPSYIDPMLSGVTEQEFSADDYDWPFHLKTALDQLPTKSALIARAMNYYEGDHPRFWLTEALRSTYDDLVIPDMSENWCDLAVDAFVKRQEVIDFDGPGREEAARVFEDNDLDLGQKDLYTTARAAGEAFLFSWPSEEKNGGLDVVQVDPRQVWWPKSAHRADPVRVVRVWADEDEGIWRATCYYRYDVVRLVGPKINGAAFPQARYFVVDEGDPGGAHGFDRVPVVRFSVRRERRSILDGIIPIQDKISKLGANMMVSAEFNAYRKMAIMTTQEVSDDDLHARPNRIFKLDPGGDNGTGEAPTSIWEGSATELSNFSNEQTILLDKLFTKATLPAHLKVRSEAAGAVSGAAYEADEGPFVEAVNDTNKIYGASWQDLFRLIGVEVKPMWRSAAAKSESSEVATVKESVDAGVPLELALKKYGGWTDEEIKALQGQPLSPAQQKDLAMARALVDPTLNGVTGDAQATDDGTTDNTPSAAPANPGE